MNQEVTETPRMKKCDCCGKTLPEMDYPVARQVLEYKLAPFIVEEDMGDGTFKPMIKRGLPPLCPASKVKVEYIDAGGGYPQCDQAGEHIVLTVKDWGHVTKRDKYWRGPRATYNKGFNHVTR